MSVYSLLGWVADEDEMKLVDPTVNDFRFMCRVLVRALKTDRHESELGLRAEEILEDVANLLGCAEDNLEDVIAARIPIVLGAVLYGPLQPQPEKVKPGEYIRAEKLLALRCCYTLCFKEEGRAAIAANPRLAGCMFLRNTSIQYYIPLCAICRVHLLTKFLIRNIVFLFQNGVRQENCCCPKRQCINFEPKIVFILIMVLHN